MKISYWVISEVILKIENYNIVIDQNRIESSYFEKYQNIKIVVGLVLCFICK